MKVTIFPVAIVLMVSMAALSQDQSSSTQQEERRPPQDQQQQPQKRPTLGPAPAPTLYGPKTSNTADPRKLARVRKIYIERMDNTLDEKLVELLAKSRRFRIVGSRNEADAVMHGTCFDSRRLKVLRSEVYLNDPSGASIWQDSIRRPINPPTIEAAVSETANFVVTHLSESATEAERH